MKYGKAAILIEKKANGPLANFKKALPSSQEKLQGKYVAI